MRLATDKSGYLGHPFRENKVRKYPASQPAYTGSIGTDHELLQIVGSALSDAAARAGGHLACYPGCAVCCFGPFPITLGDAARLRNGWRALGLHRKDVADAIEQRAAATRERLAKSFPGDPATGVISDGMDEAAFAARFADLPCPVLDPDSGCCLLYESRPIACRTYGLPSRIDGVALPPCPLCFRHASPAEVEAARAIIDFPPDAPDEPRTVIAYAFPSPPRP